MADKRTENKVTYPPLDSAIQSGKWWHAVRYFGPGAIVASATIGSGETLFASRGGAIFGYSLLWCFSAGMILKGLQVYSGARYMSLSGEHLMERWSQLPGPRNWFPWMMFVLCVVCFPFWLAGLPMMSMCHS